MFTGGTITGSHTLHNVEIRGGTVTIAAGTTLTAAGTLNLFSGTLNQAPHRTLAAQGDLVARVGFTGGGTATLLIDGGGAQTFTGFHTSAAGALPNVNIAKPAGTLTIAGTLRTGRNWTYTSGGWYHRQHAGLQREPDHRGRPRTGRGRAPLRRRDRWRGRHLHCGGAADPDRWQPGGRNRRRTGRHLAPAAFDGETGTLQSRAPGTRP